MMVIATFFWSIMAINSRYLSMYNLPSTSISFFRCFTAAVLLTLTYLIKDRSVFKIGIKGLIFCIVYGAISYAFGLTLYSLSVERVPIAVATVLMFSNPIWVTIFNYFLFKEGFSTKKAILITTCIIGCLMVIDIFENGSSNLDMWGVIFGAFNGLTFALQIIIPKMAKNKYSKDSMLLYGFWSAAIILGIFVDFPGIKNSIINSNSPWFIVLNILCVGVFSTYVASSLYLKCTDYIGTSLPSMMVALEPIFASFMAFLVFQEAISPMQVLGAVIVILSVISLEINFKKRVKA